MRKLQKHMIVMLDRDTRTGICAECGAVEVRICWKRREQREMIECRNYVKSKQRPGKPNWHTRRRYRETPQGANWASRGKYSENRPNSHGLTRDEARARLENASCEICRAPATVNDHCHESGALRGTLCRPCNIALGLVEDSTDRLHAAVAYLDRYRAAG